MKNSNEKWWHYIKEPPPYLGKNCKNTISEFQLQLKLDEFHHAYQPIVSCQGIQGLTDQVAFIKNSFFLLCPIIHHLGNSCRILMKKEARRLLNTFIKITTISNCEQNNERVFSSVLMHAIKRREERLHLKYGISECFQDLSWCINLNDIPSTF